MPWLRCHNTDKTPPHLIAPVNIISPQSTD
jgi:hypothetical protein